MFLPFESALNPVVNHQPVNNLSIRCPNTESIATLIRALYVLLDNAGEGTVIKVRKLLTS